MRDFRSDQQRVEDAFAKLETQGFLTLAGEVCCNGCSQGALSQRYGPNGDMPPLYAYYCEQDAMPGDRRMQLLALALMLVFAGYTVAGWVSPNAGLWYPFR